MRAKIEVMPGMRFTNYEVIRLVKDAERGRDITWECRCDCGAISNVNQGSLIHRTGRTCRFCNNTFGCNGAAAEACVKHEPGERFGSWTLVERRGDIHRWLCRCDCGTEKLHSMSTLTGGKSTKCRACQTREKQKNIAAVGKKYTNYTVLRLVKDAAEAKDRVWECRCDCGEIQQVTESALRVKKRKHCPVCSIVAAREQNTKFKYHPGEKYGSFTLLYLDRKSHAWVCRCDCGRESKVQAYRFTVGAASKCRDCANRERREARAAEVKAIKERKAAEKAKRRRSDSMTLVIAPNAKRTNSRKAYENAPQVAKNESYTPATAERPDVLTRDEFREAHFRPNHPMARWFDGWLEANPQDTYSPSDWMRFVSYYDEQRAIEHDERIRRWRNG